MEDIKLAEKLWDIANVVTGFAVAQVLATTFAMGNHQMAMLSVQQAHWPQPEALSSLRLFIWS